ncbi:MAG: peptide-methionine (R)-S-oxide reductase MsrB [Olleya sp.]
MSNYKVHKSEEDWRQELTEEQYRILRKKGTEMPHTGKYNLHFEDGSYHCAGCNQQLFESDRKFESSCGWPSFDDAIKGSVQNILDKSHGMIRTEIVCSNCGGHLGHVFNDGPTATGTRFCVNSASVDFNKNE